MRPQTFLKPDHLYKPGEKLRLEAKEEDRKAIRNRMIFYEFTKEYDDDTEFPYEADELARYMDDYIKLWEQN